HPALHSFPTRRSSDLVSISTGSSSGSKTPVLANHHDHRVAETTFGNQLPNGFIANGSYGGDHLPALPPPDYSLSDSKADDLEGQDRKSTRLNSSHVSI